MKKCISSAIIVFQRHYASRRILKTVIGIETSCDDTAVAIVQSDRRTLSFRRMADRNAQKRLGGIAPLVVAEQHRTLLPSLIEQCLSEARIRLCDLDAIAVTIRPGLVLPLKAGIHKALQLARIGSIPLIPIHHMRAHALSGFLVSSTLSFPFVSALLSGGHSLFILCQSPSDFSIIGSSQSGSAGECLDKIGRRLGIHEDPYYSSMHMGAAIEQLAKSASSDGHLRYSIRSPHTVGGNMNFSILKSSFLTLIDKAEKSNDYICVEDFCASVQHQIGRHIAIKLHASLEFLKNARKLEKIHHMVISGGVAANQYIGHSIRKVCSHYRLETIQVPPRLCTDNAEMIAWNGIQLLEENSPDIFSPSSIPDSLYATAKCPIGMDLSDTVPKRPKWRLSGYTVHGDLPLKFTQDNINDLKNIP